MESFQELEQFEGIIITKINEELVSNGYNISEDIFLNIKRLQEQSIENIREYIYENNMDINYYANLDHFIEQILKNNQLDYKLKLNITTKYFNKLFNYHLSIYYLIHEDYIIETIEDDFYRKITNNTNLKNYYEIVFILFITLKKNNIIKIYYKTEILPIFDTVINDSLWFILSTGNHTLSYIQNFIKLIDDFNDDIIIKNFMKSTWWHLTESIDFYLEDKQINDNIIKIIFDNLNTYFNNVFEPIYNKLNKKNKIKVLDEIKKDINDSEYKDLLNSFSIKFLNIWKYKSPLLLICKIGDKSKKRKINELKITDLPDDIVRVIINYL